MMNGLDVPSCPSLPVLQSCKNNDKSTPSLETVTLEIPQSGGQQNRMTKTELVPSPANFECRRMGRSRFRESIFVNDRRRSGVGRITGLHCSADAQPRFSIRYWRNLQQESRTFLLACHGPIKTRMCQSPEPGTVDGAVNLSNCCLKVCSALLRPLRRRGRSSVDIGKASSLAEAMLPFCISLCWRCGWPDPPPRPTFQ